MSAWPAGIPFTKAHAYGNDFLFVAEEAVSGRDGSTLAQLMCERHTGLGADGLILYRDTSRGARMRLYNADGSSAEVSGNGVRCLAAMVVDAKDMEPGDETVIETDGGIKSLVLLAQVPPRFTFDADMGRPSDLRRLTIDVDGESVSTIVMSVGNPQCIVVVDRLDEDRFRHLGARLSTHPVFPKGTNVELVEVTERDRLRILIWERGVGPTSSSGTGSCASAVGAAFDGRVGRSVDVVSPGGVQHVEWGDDAMRLTGWAEIVARGEWLE